MGCKRRKREDQSRDALGRLDDGSTMAPGKWTCMARAQSAPWAGRRRGRRRRGSHVEDGTLSLQAPPPSVSRCLPYGSRSCTRLRLARVSPAWPAVASPRGKAPTLRRGAGEGGAVWHGGDVSGGICCLKRTGFDDWGGGATWSKTGERGVGCLPTMAEGPCCRVREGEGNTMHGGCCFTAHVAVPRGSSC